LEGVGHRITLRSVTRAPSTLYRVIRDSPEVVHACGRRSWRVAGVAARLTGAAVVLDVPPGARAGDRRARRLVRAGPLGVRGAAVLVEEERQAREVRSALRLPYLPPVVSGPRLSPTLGRQGRGGALARVTTLLPALGNVVRPSDLRRPAALAAYLRGRLLRAAGRSREAVLALARARRRDPENDRYALYLARAMREAGSGSDAGQVLTPLVDQLGDVHPRVLGEVGLELARLGEREEARKAADSLCAVGERGGESAPDALAQAALIGLACGDLAGGRRLAAAAAEEAPRGSPAQRAAALALERAGEPSEALKLAEESGAGDQVSRVTGLLRQLGRGWAPSLPAIRRSDQGARGYVLYLLEVSMPQVPSGYAYRSRDVLAALATAGLEPVAATRLGFPASRGIADYSPVESVYGVVHHRFNFDNVRQYSGIPVDRLATVNAERLLELIERIRPSLLLAGTPSLNGSVGRALSAAAQIPFVYDVRGFPEMTWAALKGGAESELYRLRREAETGCCAEADAVITTSETMKSELVGRGIDPRKVTVVPHVVDPHRYSPRAPDEALARSYGLDRGFVVGSVTSLTDYEGIDDLLRAVAQARADEDVRALVVGDGPARTGLQSLAAELGIEDAVVFTGRVAQHRVVEHYALLDVFALPRRDIEVCRTVTPLKPFEAMAMGIPVIASDLPALAEPLTQSGGGMLVPAGSEQALTAAILQLARDAPTRQRLGSNARTHLIDHHDPPVAAGAIRSALVPLLG
jgi:glycosyltransferase involved in cell wall biosynthesis/tetratricopeptide (TPR) repeat protein